MEAHKGNNNELDHLIRAKLKGLRPDFSPGSWEQLSDRLDQVEDEAAFDQDMQRRLRSMHVPYQESSWAPLAARLELERRRVQAVIHFKLMEVSLLLLLLITGWQMIPGGETPAAPPSPQLPIAELTPPVENEAIETEVFQVEVEKPAIVEQVVANQSIANRATPVETEASTAIANTEISPLKLTITDNSLRLPQGSIATQTTNQLPTTALNGIDYDTPNAQEQLRTFFAEKTEQLTTPSDPFVAEGPLAALHGGEMALLDYGEAEDLLDFIRPIERKTFLRIGFVGSPDYNRVISPDQTIADGTRVGFDRYSLGYGGGITLGIEHGKWEVELGALYAARRYQSIPTVYVTGSLREGYSALGLSEFELNTVQVPLHFRYNALLHDKWRLYAQAGPSINVVLDANYYLADQSDKTGLQPPSEPNSNFEKPAALRAKSLTPGWIEGGTFQENATLYGDVAVGLERYMTPQWSMFVQPTYRHAVTFFNEGLGPYQDRIHSFNISMGLKVRL